MEDAGRLPGPGHSPHKSHKCAGMNASVHSPSITSWVRPGTLGEKLWLNAETQGWLDWRLQSL